MALADKVTVQKNKPGISYAVVIKAGMTAGILDGLAAILLNLNINPLGIFRYIASGVLGSAAFKGGVLAAFFGLILHLLIAHIWALIFFVIYSKSKILHKNIYVTGIAYGLFVWLIMNLIVVPLSNTPAIAITMPGALKGIAILIVCVGLPVSLIIKKYYSIKG